MNPRLVVLVVALFLIPILPWLAVGRQMEDFIQVQLAEGGFAGTHRVALAVVGVLLLAADSFLPVPSTTVMSALGAAFGTVGGGLLASAGLCLCGLVAFGTCRRWGERWAVRLVGPNNLEKMQRSVTRIGPLTIAVTRAVPVLQEVSACAAGIGRMPFRRFCFALVGGSLPTGFIYAAVGAYASQAGALALMLSVLIPATTWLVVFGVFRSLNATAKRPGELPS